jgi:uncharacterized protein (DUF1778 family)
MPAHPSPNDACLNLRLPAELKRTIEQAATRTGQSVSGFAISTLARTARDVIDQETITRLSNRDRDVFVSLLDGKEVHPNTALTAAAREYKNRIR